MDTFNTLTDLFRRTVRWYPDEVAFIQTDGDMSYTYAEANTEACRFANALAGRGISKGDRVAFLSRARADHAVGYLGTQKIGAVPATLHNRESEPDIISMVRDIEPEALVFQPRFAEVAAAIHEGGTDIEVFVTLGNTSEVPDFAEPFSSFVASESADEPDATVKPSDTGVIVFSSGSTGQPKGVVHSHENLARSTLLGLYFYEIRDSDNALFAITPSFVAWQDQILSWIAIGATILFREEFDENAILDLIETHRVTSLTLVPTHWRRLLAAGMADRNVESLRVAGYSGAIIREETLSRLVDALPGAVYTAYGSTETLNTVTKLTPERIDPENPGKLGRPITATDVKIVEPGSREPSTELDRGAVGEIAMTGPTIATEIWNNAEATAKRFQDGWWFSGDLGRIGRDNNLYLEGRVDNMIISGGINIYPPRIESILESHDEVEAVAIVGVPNEEWGEVVAATIVSADGIGREELDAWCKNHDELADYQRPRQYEFVEHLPRTSTGKIDRRALRDRFAND